MQRIGERLAEIRRASGLGVRGFAAAIKRATGYEISHTSVANYETGTTVPAAYAVVVCRTFAVGLPWLLTGEGLPGEVERPALEDAFRRIVAIVGEAMPGLRGVGAEQDAFFRASSDLFFILARGGEIVRANPAWDALLGRPVRELERTPFADLVHDEDRSVLSALLAGDEADPMKEIRVKGAGDVWIPMSLGISHVGGLTYGVARRRVRGDATTCASWREVVGSVLEHATDMFILVDDTSRCVAVNRALAQRLGTYPAALIGVSTIDELIPSQHRDEARMALRRLLNEKAATGEIALTGADGRPAKLCYRAVANVEPGVHLCVVHAQPAAGVAFANSEMGGARATGAGS